MLAFIIQFNFYFCRHSRTCKHNVLHSDIKVTNAVGKKIQQWTCIRTFCQTHVRLRPIPKLLGISFLRSYWIWYTENYWLAHNFPHIRPSRWSLTVDCDWAVTFSTYSQKLPVLTSAWRHVTPKMILPKSVYDQTIVDWNNTLHRLVSHSIQLRQTGSATVVPARRGSQAIGHWSLQRWFQTRMLSVCYLRYSYFQPIWVYYLLLKPLPWVWSQDESKNARMGLLCQLWMNRFWRRLIWMNTNRWRKDKIPSNYSWLIMNKTFCRQLTCASTSFLGRPRTRSMEWCWISYDGNRVLISCNASGTDLQMTLWLLQKIVKEEF